MASNKITNLFKGNFLNKKSHSISLKKILVTFQFSISLFLIALTVSFSLQINYITHKNLGFNKNDILYCQINATAKGVSFQQLREQIKKNIEVQDISMSQNFPFVKKGGGTTNWEGANEDEKITCRFNKISYNFLSMLETSIVLGRNFSTEFKSDVGKSCIINETAAQCFGWDNPIGKRIKDNKLTIIGVVKNYIYADMHNEIEPAVYTLAPDSITGEQILSFRINKNKAIKAKEIINYELESTFPEDPFEIKNLSLAFNNENSFRIYHSLNKSLMLFTIINILLSIVGVFGLVAYTATRRTKEIGIRKINGSSTLQIFHLLNTDFYTLLVIAVVIAVPSAWFTYMALPSANKLAAQPWVFIAGSLVLLIVVLICTGFITFKAATKNPIEALRYE